MSVMAMGAASGNWKASVSAWTLPMRPAPITPRLSLGIVVFDGPQVLAIAAGAFLRAAHAGKHVLLYQRVAGVVVGFQPAQDSGEIDAAFAEFTEDAVTEGLEVVPAFGAGAVRDVWIAVFKVDVPDAVLETVESFDHAGATGSVRIVAGVEH